MKKLLNILSVIAVIGAAAAMIGCGDSNNDGQNVPATQQAANNTPASLAGRSFRISSSGASSNAVVTFNADGSYSIPAHDAAAAESGNYTYSTNANGTATVVLNQNAPNAGRVNTVILTFNAANSGSFSSSQTGGTGGNTTESGTFASDTGGNNNGGTTTGGTTGTTTGGTTGTTTGGTTGTTTGGTTGTTTGGTTGTTTGGTTGGTTSGGLSDNTTLVGKKVQLSVAAAGELLIITSANTLTDSDLPMEGTGSYTYALNTSTQVGTLHVQFPATGDVYDLVLTYSPGSTTQGTLTGNEHFENADHAINGTFSLTSQ